MALFAEEKRQLLDKQQLLLESKEQDAEAMERESHDE